MKMRQPTVAFRGHSDDAIQAIFLPDGRLVSCSRDKTVRIWNATSGAEQAKLTGHTAWVASVVLLPNGLLASCSGDMNVIIWDLNQMSAIRTLTGHTNEVVSLKVLKNGNLASYSMDDTIKIWNPYQESDNLIRTIQGHDNPQSMLPLALLSNGYLVTGSRNEVTNSECIVKVWNPNDGVLVKSIPTGLKGFRRVLTLETDELALGFETGMIMLLDWTGKTTPRKFQAHSCYITALAQLSNGNLLSAGNNGQHYIRTISMWDLQSLKCLQSMSSYHGGAVCSLTLSPDEAFFASASRDNSVKLWPISDQATSAKSGLDNSFLTDLDD